MDKEESPLKQIRTFQGDVAEALEKQKESLVSIQRAEQIKKGGAVAFVSPEISEKKKQFFYLLLGTFFFLALGGIGAYYAYNAFILKTAVPEVNIPENRFISTNTETVLNLTDLSRESLITSLSDSTLGVGAGELKHVVLNTASGEETKLLSTGDFLAGLESRAPGNLVRALSPLFMYGALGENVFLIMKVDSFENAFSGMLNWERNLSKDLGPLFSTREILIGIPEDEGFSDITDRNEDVRALLSDGVPVLLYAFADNETLVITDSIDALRTLLDRLTQEKLSR